MHVKIASVPFFRVGFHDHVLLYSDYSMCLLFYETIEAVCLVLSGESSGPAVKMPLVPTSGLALT